MKSKELLELKKMKQEIELIREQKNHLVHSLEWYKQSAETIEKHYNLLKNQLERNEERMEQAEKWITSLLDNYGLKMCEFYRCRNIKPQTEMKYLDWDREKMTGDEYYCDDNCLHQTKK